MRTQETGKQIVGALKLGARVDDVISRSTDWRKDKPGQAANFGKPSLHAPKKENRRTLRRGKYLPFGSGRKLTNQDLSQEREQGRGTDRRRWTHCRSVRSSQHRHGRSTRVRTSSLCHGDWQFLAFPQAL